MSGALTVDAVVRDGKIHVTDEYYKTRCERAAKKWGDGCVLTIRIEPAEEAVRYGQYKYWHGYVLAPLIEYTGDQDWRLELKAMFLPDGKHSLTELTHDEMQAFTEQSEAWARERCPEAYEKYGLEYVG
jgi:hypothetical protein